MERKQYAKLVPLVQNPSAVKTPKDLDLDEVAKAVAKSFEQSRDLGSFEYYVLEDNATTPFRLELKGGKPVIGGEATGKANFECGRAAPPWPKSQRALTHDDGSALVTSFVVE